MIKIKVDVSSDIVPNINRSKRYRFQHQSFEAISLPNINRLKPYCFQHRSFEAISFEAILFRAILLEAMLLEAILFAATHKQQQGERADPL
ncbi:hypothetical protein MJO29_002474 [Puccinia striiformis f. sp. tritici]|nr:hypothetical protein MJO29_002474 [Puccinia striiformis f. sp. tritici]